MVSIKKIDYRRRNSERKLFFGFPAVPFTIFLTFIALLLMFNLFITNSTISNFTGNVVNLIEIQNPQMAYTPGQTLQGTYSLQFQKNDLIPDDAYVEVSMSSPACALYYVCSDGTKVPWKTYDPDTGNCSDNTEKKPWIHCPEGTIESVSDTSGQTHHSCGSDENFKIGTCCSVYTYGQGNYYENLDLDCASGRCFDSCGVKQTFTLQQYILIYNKENGHSEVPYLGNYIEGTYANAGKEIAGLAVDKGPGFTYCAPITPYKPPIQTAAITPITGNAILTESQAGIEQTIQSTNNPVRIYIKRTALSATTNIQNPLYFKLMKVANQSFPCAATAETAAVIKNFLTGNAVYSCETALPLDITSTSIDVGSYDFVTSTQSLPIGTQLRFYIGNSDFSNSVVTNFLTTDPSTTEANLNITGISGADINSNQVNVTISNNGGKTSLPTTVSLTASYKYSSTYPCASITAKAIASSYTCTKTISLGAVNLDSIGAGRSVTKTFNLDSTQSSLLNVGTTLTAYVSELTNSLGISYESVSEDNIKSSTIQAPPAQADLIISQLQYNYNLPGLQGKITNIGGATAAASKATVCVVGGIVANPVTTEAIVKTTSTTLCSIINTKDIESLEPGYSTGWIDFYTDPSRSYEGSTVRITIDSGSVISEGTTGESNNINETYITPLRDLANLQVSDIQYQCNSVYTPNPRIAVIFNNSGATNAISTSENPIVLSIYNCSSIPASAIKSTTGTITAKATAVTNPSEPTCQLITSSIINEIEAGASKIETFDASGMLGLNIKAVIDSGNVIQESNETDNSRYLAVPKIDFEINNLIYTGSLTAGTGILWFNVTNKGNTASAPKLTVYRCNRIITPPIRPPIQTAAITPITGNLISSESCIALVGYDNLQLTTINAGRSITINVPDPEGVETVTGPEYLKIIVDPQSLICESDETNNQVTWSYWSSFESCGGEGENFSIEQQDSCTDGITGEIKYDQCINNDILQEWSCGNGIECLAVNYSCSERGYANCTVDRCIPIPVTSCIDTDMNAYYPEGRNYDVKGTCTGEDGIAHTDSCPDAEGQLQEWYCAGNACEQEIITTPDFGLQCFGCYDGACVKNPYVCGTWNNIYNLDFTKITGNGLLSTSYLTAPEISNNSYYTLSIKLKGIGSPCDSPLGCDPTITESSQIFKVTSPAYTWYQRCSGSSCIKDTCYDANGCADECTTNGQCGSSGGGGGGGGGSTLCTDDWQCSIWSDCSTDGQRTRSCSRCGSTRTESEVCVYQCIPNWECSEWGYCDESGEQSQVCTDKNRCVQTNNEYVQTRDCCVENWDYKWGTCVNGKQEKVGADLNKCGTTFLKAADETRDCSSNFFETVPIGVKIAVPVVIVGGILASLFLLRRKSYGSIGKITKTQSTEKSAPLNKDYPELGNYIKNSRSSGMKDSDIKAKLSDAGWPKDVIDKAFK